MTYDDKFWVAIYYIVTPFIVIGGVFLLNYLTKDEDNEIDNSKEEN